MLHVAELSLNMSRIQDQYDELSRRIDVSTEDPGPEDLL